MILDVVCLWISFTLAFNMRHGSLDVLANSLYRDMMWSLALMDIVVIFFFDSLKNVLKRGFYQEFVMTVKQTCLITLCSVFYLFTFKEAENYSRLVLGYTAALYLLISYVLRCLWKNCLRKYFGGAEKRSLLIVTVSDIVDTVIDNIKNKNYGDYFVTGVCMLDKKAKGRVIDGVTVVADEDDLVEYVCREWVDEVFINIPESEPYPAELLDKFIEMGVVVHMKLAKSQNLLGKKQFVEHLGTYTVLTTSINSVSRRQIILKRMINFHTANLRPTKSLGVREPRVWLSETKRKTPECSGVSFFRAGNSNSLTNAFHICVYVHLCVVPRYIASQHPWKQSQSLLQNTKETTAGHFRRSVFLLSGRIPGVHELLWKAASLSCGRYR